MASDFHYYCLNFKAAREYPNLPGGLAAAAPRMANRLRKEDLIAMLLTLRGDGVDTQELDKIMQQLAQVFFQTMGSVTRAMNAVCMEINRLLMEYNLDSAHEGKQVEGMLNLAALHKGALFICHAGPTSSFVLHADVVEIFEDGMDVKPMGANRNVQVQYYQANIQPGNILIFSPDPPQTWSAANLSGSSYLSMDLVRRRLLNQVGSDLQAAVIKILPGSGRIHFGAWGDQPTAAQTAAVEEEALQGAYRSPLDELQQVQALTPESVIPASRSLETIQPGQEPARGVFEAGQVEVPSQTKEERIGQSVSEPIEEDVVPIKPGVTEQAQPRGEKISSAAKKSPKRQPTFLQNLAQTWQKGEGLRNKLRDVTGGVFKKLFPQSAEWKFMTSGVLIFLLVALPLVLIAASLTVYSRSGKDEQFNGFLDLAQQYATLAGMQSDPAQQHLYWSKALESVSKAELYGSNTQSSSLQRQAQTTLDAMDLTKRLDFRPALTQLLPKEVKISRIVAVGTDVYLLDGVSGNVLRMTFNQKGYYELDATFKCGPGPSGLNTIKTLIDFVGLPANQPYDYKVLAIDVDGNLLYCLPGESPSSQRLPAPNGSWGKITAITLDQGILYVLDAVKDAVWFFPGSGINFSASPKPFFDTSIPKLEDAIDLAVDQEALFVLHADGHMTTCQYSAYKDVKETTCSDPAPYTDSRLGREKNPWLFMDANFISMQSTHLQEASIFILDDKGDSVYQISYQLNLVNTLKVQPSATFPIPDKAPTAFTITSSRNLFLAFGNQVFFASLP